MSAIRSRRSWCSSASNTQPWDPSKFVDADRGGLRRAVHPRRAGAGGSRPAARPIARRASRTASKLHGEHRGKPRRHSAVHGMFVVGARPGLVVCRRAGGIVYSCGPAAAAAAVLAASRVGWRSCSSRLDSAPSSGPAAHRHRRVLVAVLPDSLRPEEPQLITVNLIGHQQMSSRAARSPAYALPHLLNRDTGRAAVRPGARDRRGIGQRRQPRARMGRARASMRSRSIR